MLCNSSIIIANFKQLKILDTINPELTDTWGRCRINEIKYSRKDQVKFFKGCFPQFLLDPFLNTLAQIAWRLHTTYSVAYESLFHGIILFLKLKK